MTITTVLVAATLLLEVPWGLFTVARKLSLVAFAVAATDVARQLRK